MANPPTTVNKKTTWVLVGRNSSEILERRVQVRFVFKISISSDHVVIQRAVSV